jgi:preprotein translocase subunit YajC
MPAAGVLQQVVNIAPFALIGLMFYILILRPQQQRAKDHLKSVKAVKRGDTVVLSSGLIGKVVRVEDAEIGIEIAQGVTVKVIKDMIHTVRARGAPVAANDAKA